jgi:regulator of sirC expression with transglutaminase-like and TPR domain
MDATRAAEEFAELIGRCGERGAQPPLDRAGLLISAVFDRSVDVAASEAQLDALAERARSTATATDSYAMTGAVLDAIFGAAGFRGNTSAYDDPRNSLLAQVLDRRTGIPITLSIVVIEVARRIGLQLSGVGLPGHFVVRFPDATSRLYIDAFDKGRIIDVARCVALVERQTGGRITWSDAFLDPVAPKAMLKRVLVNLKNALTRAQDYPSALAAIELQLALDPGDPTELRDRAILFARLHRYDRAIEDFEAYLARRPDAADGKHIRDRVLRYLREARNL